MMKKNSHASKTVNSSMSKVSEVLSEEKLEMIVIIILDQLLLRKELYWGVDRLNYLEEDDRTWSKEITSNESLAPLSIKAPEILDSDKLI